MKYMFAGLASIFGVFLVLTGTEALLLRLFPHRWPLTAQKRMTDEEIADLYEGNT